MLVGLCRGAENEAKLSLFLRKGPRNKEFQSCVSHQCSENQWWQVGIIHNHSYIHILYIPISTFCYITNVRFINKNYERK